MSKTHKPCSTADYALHDMVFDCLRRGEKIPARNGNTFRTLGHTFRFDRPPLVTVRRTAWKTALYEWEWFMSGSSNLKDLHESARPWWKEWADGNGRVKHNYGRQLRAFTAGDRSFDQIEHLIKQVRENPYSRRSVGTTWNPQEMAAPDCKITNCHGTVIQFHGHPDGGLTLETYQRSCDVMVGVPQNWVQYWAFLEWVCRRAGRTPRELVWHGGDCHVYEAHKPAAEEFISRHPAPANRFKFLYDPADPTTFRAADFALDREYQPVLDYPLPLVV
jgi:thymidylate synthase